jgi:peptidoglycan/LPS O-acetylase OafA/YrhL
MASDLTGVWPANFPAWSIVWEFYLPIVAAFSPWRVPKSAVVPLLIVCLIGLAIAGVFEIQGGELHFLRAVLGLGGGYLLYRSGFDTRLPFLPVLCLLGAIMVVAYYLPLVTLLLPLVACGCVLASRTSQTVLSTAPIQFLGQISYTTYMVHIPVLMAMAWGWDLRQGPVVKILGIALTLVLAYLLTVLVERPFQKVLRTPSPQPAL